MTIIDGKGIADKIREEIRLKVASLDTKPGLAVVLVGENPASEIYVGMKEKACQEIGFLSKKIELPAVCEQVELLDIIDKLNHDPSIHGILVQMPLPKHIDSNEIIEAIKPEKDVDGFHPINLGKLLIGKPDMIACTPLGCLELLKRSDVELVGKNACVIGRSNIVGKPMASLLLNEDCTVTICHSKTKDLNKVIMSNDIVIAAVGVPKLIKDVKEGAVVIDVGMNRTEEGLVGDVDLDAVKEKVSLITPVPKGVGPMTIAMLMKNTLRAYEKVHNFEVLYDGK
ncbi:bifunctional methylenetetrahydrofolate dehydrogenase/methenyltetrahydrofolate cyclohydrolase FolD [Candidatus Woesearchaeota archaeon]|nr:bifunctional methylenetetrahydrofolate dehydrogenase/methenyltetrahydrofolate cyclohydrolase FolD [Candidatus Woesearchaeota archaeon]